jgi:NAD(P)-dependent dehydrogenase (short-subunit alcohol dehydrogenase family)
MGRVAVVTGGASGIGLAIVRRLAADGASVALLDLEAGAAEEAAAELRGKGLRVIGLAADVSDRAAVEKALEAARGELGPVEIMVTSAGLSLNAPFVDITVEDWERVLAVNLTGTFHCLQLAVPDMIAGGWGRIVTISSSSAQSGSRTQAHYSASKGGVVVLTKTLALELGQYGITVNTIPPRAVITPMFLAAPFAQGPEGEERVRQLAERSPVRRLGVPEDIAATAAFLCSDDAGYITGQVIGVNGGNYT